MSLRGSKGQDWYRLGLMWFCSFHAMPVIAAGASSQTDSAMVAFPRPYPSYQDSGQGLLEALGHRIAEEPFNLVALLIFIAAILHTFLAGKFVKWSHDVDHRYAERRKQQGQGVRDPNDVSFLGKLLHFLGEIEAIFGIWVIALILAIVYFYDWQTAVSYVNDKVNYTEAMFVVVIMTIAATRPILNFAENMLRFFANLGQGRVGAWWLAILTIAPILGSLITEPAAMTIAALLLSKQFYRHKPSNKFKYATLGLLFVNISVGGTLTNFAAPPVLMVAGPWNWSSAYMLQHFGWKAVAGIVVSNLIYFSYFRGEFKKLDATREEQKGEIVEDTTEESNNVPFWVTLVHIGFMVWTVLNSHHPAFFIGGFLFFLGFKETTPQYQNRLELKAAILVGFFLAGLVNHGGVQGWWISPVISSLTEFPLMIIATGLTAFNDNAAITYLATLVDGLSPSLKYAVVAGAVTGGGLTVIANAPNPAGQAILNRFFLNKSISPLYLLLGALIPTLITGLAFLLLPNISLP